MVKLSPQERNWLVDEIFDINIQFKPSNRFFKNEGGNWNVVWNFETRQFPYQVLETRYLGQ